LSVKGGSLKDILIFLCFAAQIPPVVKIKLLMLLRVNLRWSGHVLPLRWLGGKKFPNQP